MAITSRRRGSYIYCAELNTSGKCKQNKIFK